VLISKRNLSAYFLHLKVSRFTRSIPMPRNRTESGPMTTCSAKLRGATDYQSLLIGKSGVLFRYTSYFDPDLSLSWYACDKNHGFTCSSEELYTVLLSCWHPEAIKRPKFSVVASTLKQLRDGIKNDVTKAL
jgi:hypothetical protein